MQDYPYLLALKQRWWIVVLVTVIASGVAYGVSKRLPNQYRADTQVLLNVSSYANSTYDAVTASQALTKTYAQIVTSAPVLDEAARRIGPAETADDLRRVSATDIPQTEIITISFTDRDPGLAAKVVNTVTQVFIERIGELEPPAEAPTATASAAPTPPADATASVVRAVIQPTAPADVAVRSLSVIAPATPPAAPYSPRPKQNAILGAVFGLIFGAALVAVLCYFGYTARSTSDGSARR